MWANLRLALAALVLFMVVAVDFTSRLLSMAADGLLVVVLIAILWPIIRPAKS